MSQNSKRVNKRLLDRADMRVKHQAGIGVAITTFIDRVKSGIWVRCRWWSVWRSSGRCFRY